MKLLFVLALALVLAVPALAKRGGEGSREGGEGHKKRARAEVDTAQPKEKRGAPAFRPDKRHTLREGKSRSRITHPRQGPDRKVLHAKPFARREMASPEVRRHLGELTRDRAFLAGLPRLHREERVAGRYYWHRWREADYCHYYDRWGYHWYGWYLGPRFFWVRVYGGRWWWYDDVRLRWCFWHHGGWWWPDPLHLNVVYVYRDGDYVEADEDESEAEGLNTTAEEGKAPYLDPKDMPPAPEEIPAAP